MDRNKRPALTSPWKIGFLVSLLLVTVSIGVGFAITRTFGVEWSWIRLGGDTWVVFDLNAFVQEMIPLVVIVPVMSLLAYFVITGAVRKYRAYFDSGLDYRNLVKSIRKIDDLQEDRIKSLGDYPELRDFLLKLRQRITEREKSLDEREAGIGSREEGLSAAEEYKAEALVLTGAVKRGPVDGFGEELAVSIPEIKQIEQAIREHLLVGAASMTMNDFGEQMRNVREELEDSAAALNDAIGGLSAEMIANQNGAREIELYLSQLKATAPGSGSGAAGGAGDSAATLALIDRLDLSSAALAALGEETKSIAINTALQAGQGEGGLAELVKLADSVRDTAARFNGIAAQNEVTGQQIRAALQSMPAEGGDGQLAETIDTLSGKVTYWVERAVVIGEKLNSFEQQFAEMTAAFLAKLGGESRDEDYQVVDDFTAPEQHSDAAAQENPDVEAQSPPPVTANIAGLEQNTNLFEEISGSSEDNLFADIPADPDSVHTGLTGVLERNEIHSPASQAEAPQAEAPPAEAPPAEAPQAEAPPAEAPPAEAPPAEAPQAEAPPAEAPQAEAPPAEAPQPEEPAAAETAAPSELFEEMETPPAPQAKAPPLSPPAGESRIEPGEFVQAKVNVADVEVEATEVPAAAGQQSPPVDASLDLESHRQEAAPAQTPEKEKVIDLYELGAVDYEPSIHTSA